MDIVIGCLVVANVLQAFFNWNYDKKFKKFQDELKELKEKYNEKN
ncbi:hypothetical protein [Helicobacter didelphidarum]|nr:hypothetical protein [Helicobacter didelphidarum]